MVTTRKNEGRIFNLITVVLLSLFGLAALFPMLYVLSVSITPYTEVLKNGGFIIIPRSITFAAYAELFKHPYIFDAFKVTVFITVVGTAVNLFLTCLMAYPLSRKNMPGRNVVLMLIVFTLLFSGGIIPTYLIVKSTGLLDTVWAMIIPTAVNGFYLLIMKSFIQNLPEEIFESARIDGAREFRILLQLVLPLSTPVLFTLGLFYTVQHWNEYFQALIYITDPTLNPIQIVIHRILMNSQNADMQASLDEVIPTLSLKMASVVYATLPIIVVYPFVQKYFYKGMVIGAVKG
ncbi:carbohydrate ABC transporter permease [Paenibacillus sp. GXUN7292]|uniref:carbohydrate ABC transporter permease n=1 Tax=Paenibacillus sp. GXUN7292 TaxID=3422499 RepID=UPI003D7F020D